MVVLTAGAIPRILAGETIEDPVLQILAHKGVPGEGQQRCRFLISDGQHSYQCCIMMGDQLLARVQVGDFDKFTVIKLKNYSCSEVSGKKVIIMLEPIIVAKAIEVGRRIGQPGAYDPNAATPTLPPTPGQNGQQNQVQVKVEVKKEPLSQEVNHVPMSRDTPRAARPTQYQQNNNQQYNSNNSNSSNNNNNGMSGNADVFQTVWPISQLTPYQNKWAIKGRVTSKSGVRSWSNANGEGKLFSFSLGDDSGEIRVTAFKQECEKYSEIIEVNKIVGVSKAVLKQANKKYTGGINHEYELTLTSDSIVHIFNQNDGSCPQMKFDFVKIRDLENVEVNASVDIVGVCREIGELSTIQSKNTQRELRKRDISLVDDSEAEVRFTVWNDEAERLEAQEGSVIVIKRARVGDYQGRTLSTGQATTMMIDPNMPVANGLKDWFSRNGSTINVTKMTGDGGSGGSGGGNLMTLDTITRDNVQSQQNNALYASYKVTVTQTGKCHIYLACPSGCKKKLVEMNNGFFKCEKCNVDTMQGEPRLLLNFCVSDVTSSQWVTAFHDEAEKLIGQKADYLKSLHDENEQEFSETISEMNFKPYIMKFKTIVDNFKEEMRTRTTLIQPTDIDMVDYAKKLLANIKEMSNE